MHTVVSGLTVYTNLVGIHVPGNVLHLNSNSESTTRFQIRISAFAIHNKSSDCTYSDIESVSLRSPDKVEHF